MLQVPHTGTSRPGGVGGGCHTPQLCCPAIFQVKLTHIQVKFKSGRGIVEREIKNAKSKEVMTMLFDVAKTLARNRLAFRGNDDDENENFRQIVYLLTRHNSVMKSWFDGRESRKHKTTYLSPRSQTEYVSLLEEEVRKEISNRVKKVSFCSVMADTTPEVSHSDELSVALRFINSDTSEPEERLVRIMGTKDKTFRDLTFQIYHWKK